MLIDIGAAASDRATSILGGYTTISLDNPANASGTITSVEIWANVNITGMRVGTFYLVSHTTYKCRDSAVIGDVTAGSKQTFPGLSIDVEAGDLIGCYWDDGKIEMDSSGFAGWYEVSGEHIDPGDEAEYSLREYYAQSLYGTGETAPPVVAGYSFGIVIG
ncbi:hypothetical protein ES708_34225 [subsurface metagenome]